MKYIEFRTIGPCHLYHADALDILPHIKGDLVSTDPPYELETGGNNPKDPSVRMQGKFAVDRYDNSGKIVECDIDWPDFMPLLFNCLNDPGHAYVMCNNRHVKDMLNEAEKSGFKFHNLLVWDKATATPNRWYMKNCEFTGFFYKGKAFFVNDCGAKQLIYIPQEEYGGHPTPKPVMLMRHYIEQSTQPGQTVIDPFMGVGSTGVAALRSGRRFIGIEKGKKWFDIACARIEKEYQNGRFAQENLL